MTGSGFVSKKRNAAPNVKDHRILAVDGLLVPLGPSHFGMTPTTEAAVVATNGELRQTDASNQGWSIAYAFGRRREVHSAKGREVHVQAGAQRHLGQAVFEMTLMEDLVAANTLGR